MTNVINEEKAVVDFDAARLRTHSRYGRRPRGTPRSHQSPGGKPCDDSLRVARSVVKSTNHCRREDSV